MIPWLANETRCQHHSNIKITFEQKMQSRDGLRFLRWIRGEGIKRTELSNVISQTFKSISAEYNISGKQLNSFFAYVKMVLDLREVFS
jgi:hypothetical protein